MLGLGQKLTWIASSRNLDLFHSSHISRNRYVKLPVKLAVKLSCRPKTGHKFLSFINPSIWNWNPGSIKRIYSLNSFKHNLTIIIKRKGDYLFLLQALWAFKYHKKKKKQKNETINFPRAIINANFIFQSVTLFNSVSYSWSYL